MSFGFFGVIPHAGIRQPGREAAAQGLVALFGGSLGKTFFWIHHQMKIVLAAAVLLVSWWSVCWSPSICVTNGVHFHVGVPKAQTVVLRLLAAANTPRPIASASVSSRKEASVLTSLAAVVRRATVAADESER